MKYFLTLLSFLLSLFISVSLVAADGFVQVNGTEFILDREPFRFSGTNAYFLWFGNYSCSADNPDPKGYCVPELMDKAKEMNFTVIRTWGFADGVHWEPNHRFWISFQLLPGNYREETFQMLDRVIYEASKRDIKLIIPFVNNWNDYGGMCQYVRWCNISNASRCNPDSINTEIAAIHDAFYTNECIKNLYKDYVRHLLNRNNTLTGFLYMDDPTIFAWDLANEPRCRSDRTGQTLNNWIGEMSAFVKSIDPNHLLTTGTDGAYVNKSGDRPNQWWYRGNEGQDFIMNHDWPDIDFATFHMYDYDGITPRVWIEEHIQDSHNILKKPVVMEEIGESRHPNFDSKLTDWYTWAEESGVNGDLLWMLCPTNFREGTGKCVYYPEDNLSHFIAEHASHMMNPHPPNHPPEVEEIEVIVVTENEMIEILVNATDPDGDELSYSINDTRFVLNRGVFTWQTRPGDRGTYTVIITVSDGKDDTVVDAHIIVNPGEFDCTIPHENMLISESTTFCQGEYEVPGGFNITGSNLVLNCNGSVLNGTRSVVVIDNVTNVTLKNCVLGNSISSIHIFQSRDIRIMDNILRSIYASSNTRNLLISGNLLKSSDHVIFLHRVYHSTISDNKILRYVIWGRAISLDGVDNIYFKNNIISGGGTAVQCWWNCRHNLFTGNTFDRNQAAISENDRRGGFFNTTFYHNNFIENVMSVSGNLSEYYDRESLNRFYFNNQGNYWSEYDNISEGCADSNEDGFCDSPYNNITGSEISDNFPYTYKNSWLGKMFVRGEVNNNSNIDIGDAIFILNYLFVFGEEHLCLDAADVNDDGQVDLADPIYLLNYLFAGGPEPKPPFPEPGVDPTGDGLGC